MLTDESPQNAVLIPDLLENVTLQHVDHQFFYLIVADEVIFQSRNPSFSDDQAHLGDVVGQSGHYLLLHLKN